MPKSARKKSSTGVYHVILRGINKQRIFVDLEYDDGVRLNDFEAVALIESVANVI